MLKFSAWISHLKTLPNNLNMSNITNHFNFFGTNDKSFLLHAIRVAISSMRSISIQSIHQTKKFVNGLVWINPLKTRVLLFLLYVFPRAPYFFPKLPSVQSGLYNPNTSGLYNPDCTSTQNWNRFACHCGFYHCFSINHYICMYKRQLT